MNVVIILSDQHNADYMGCSGGLTRTPHLDSLAEKGVRFTSAYSNSPFCAPARACMMTGRYPHETGNWDNATPFNGGHPSWPIYFRDSDVEFTVIGKVDFENIQDKDYGIGDVSRIRFRKTFDVLALYPEGRVTPRYRNLESHWTVYPRDPNVPHPKDTTIADDAVAWLRDERPVDRPWVLNVHFSKPHPSWTPARNLYEHYLPHIQLREKHLQPFSDLHPCDQKHSLHTCGYLQPDEMIPPMHAAYHATVEELDKEVGRVVNALDDLGLRDDTLVIYSTDHGEMLRAHGCLGKMSLYDDSARVPMIVQGPGVPSGSTCGEPVSLVDIFSTAAEAAGIRNAPFSRGASLLPIAGDTDSDRQDFAYSESHANGRVSGTFMIRTKRWKLIENVGYPPLLYDLAEDPDEMNNLAGDPAVEKILYGMRRRLYSVCSPEAVTARAFTEQRRRREFLAGTGRLFKELKQRFCLSDPDRLLLDPDAVEERYGIKIDPSVNYLE